jgi:hypothetical protein
MMSRKSDAREGERVSEITDRIRAYKETREGWDALLEFLASHTYLEAKRYADPNITALDEADWDFPFVEGSWDDVTRANSRGELTDDEYHQIVARRHAGS